MLDQSPEKRIMNAYTYLAIAICAEVVATAP